MPLTSEDYMLESIIFEDKITEKTRKGYVATRSLLTRRSRLQKKVMLAMIIGLLLGCRSAPFFHVHSSVIEHATIVVPDDFATVQQAINNASSGAVIYVKTGTYYENVLVNKSISLIGENVNTTVIDGSGVGTIIEISTDNVSITNLTVRNSGSSIQDSAIALSSVENCSINGNVLINDGYNGIMLYQSVRNTVTANIVEETGPNGIILWSSDNDTVSGNTVQKASEQGIVLQNSSHCKVNDNIVTSNYRGIALLASNGNSVSHNTVTGSISEGIRLDDPSDYNNFTENIVTNSSGYGFWMWYSSHNLFYHNFCNNTNNVLVFSDPELGYNSTNTWDNGYPAGGNYWSDYKGQDVYSGPYQNETGGDGTGDTPYVIDKYNVDRYPFMTPVVIECPSMANLLLSLIFITFIIAAANKKTRKAYSNLR